jgi:photosystem II stability/assembly factor-like uncharacterized protein
MKKLILFSILTFAFFAISFSQEYGWKKINTDTITGTIDFTDVFFVSENEGWITTNTTNNIFKTNDGGLSFITQTTQYGTQAVYAFDITYAYSGGLNGRIYYTSDGGLNWPAIGSIGITLNDLDFASSSQGYACGNHGTVFSITPEGTTNLNSPSSSTHRGISAPSVDNVWVCGGNRIYYYNGNTFTSQIAPAGTFNDIHFIDNQKGWVVGNAGIIGYTEDGGASWPEQTNPDPQNRTLAGVFFFDSDYGWAVGVDGVILHTSNGGSTWSVVGAGLTTEVLTSIHFTSATNGYVAGGGKTLLKYGELSGIGEEIKTLQCNIFPNPVKDKLQIKCSDFKTENGTIAILSLYGKEILIKEIVKGNENIELDLKNLNTGMYFCKISTDKKSSTKKMIIE